jgi:hypothetical protein
MRRASRPGKLLPWLPAKRLNTVTSLHTIIAVMSLILFIVLLLICLIANSHN